jgi:hypothetical protein
VPEEEHRKLLKSAKKIGLSGDRLNAYVYGTLDKIEKRKVRKRKRRNYS